MAIKITIKGNVHNVGYRLFLLNEADRLFIPKFDSRNVMVDSNEALIVLVDGEREKLEKFVEFVKTNKPVNAIVESMVVDEFDREVMDIDKFRSILNTEQLSKIVQVGLMIVEGVNNLNVKVDNLNVKMDKMLEKQDETLNESRDVKNVIREESEKTREHLADVIKDESEKTRGEIRSLRSDLREYMESNLKTVREEIAEIKNALRRAGIM